VDLSVCVGLKLVETAGSTLLFSIQIIQFVHFVTFALVEIMKPKRQIIFVTFSA
jgi:hypothetical protein